MRSRAPRSQIRMLADDFLNLNANIITNKQPTRKSTNMDNMDPLAISEKVLLEAAAEKDRISEVKDPERIVSCVK